MTRKFPTKSQKSKEAKAAKALTSKLNHQLITDLLQPAPDLGMRWVNFAALRFCALALNSK